MPFVGCLVPTCSTLHTANTETRAISVFRPSSLISDKDLTPVLEQCVRSNGVFELIVVIDVGDDDGVVCRTCAVARRFAKEVRLVPNLMARIMAVFNDLLTSRRMSFTACNTVGIATCADGTECVLLHRSVRGDGGFKLVQDFHTASDVTVNPTVFKNYPNVMAVVTFENGPLDVNFNVTNDVTIEELNFRSFSNMLFYGGITKAMQIVGDATLPLVHDFIDVISAQGNGATVAVFERDSIPIVTTFPTPEAGTIHILGGPRLTLLPHLKRCSRVLFTLKNVTEHEKIEIAVDEFGTISCADKYYGVPPLTSIPASSTSSSKLKTCSNVIGHDFLSTNYVIPGADGSATIDAVLDLTPITPETLLTLDIVHDHCSTVFAHLPASVPKPRVLVLCHDGTLPAKWISVAAECAQLYTDFNTTRICVISDMMAYVNYVLTRLPTNANVEGPVDQIFLAMIQGSVCRCIFINFNKTQGWTICDAIRVVFQTADDFNMMLNDAATKISNTSTRLLMTDVATLSLQRTAAKHGVQIMRIESFAKARAEGMLAFADGIANSDDTKARRICDYEPSVRFVPDVGEKSELLGSGFIPSVGADPCKLKRNIELDLSLSAFKITQQLSTFSSVEFVLFEAAEIPILHSDLTVTLTKAAFTVPTLEFDPIVSEVNYELKLPATVIVPLARGAPSITQSASMSSVESASQPMPAKTSRSSGSSRSRNRRRRRNAPVSVSVPVVPIPQPLNTARPVLNDSNVRRMKRLQEMLRGKVEFIVIFDVINSMYQVQFVSNKGFTVFMPQPRTDWYPCYVSFADSIPTFGFDAIADQKKYPRSIVWDLINILGCTVNQVKPKPCWTFVLSPLSRYDATAMIAVETALGHLILDPVRILSMILREIQTQIRTITTFTMNRVFFQIPGVPSDATLRLSKSLKEACLDAGMVCQGTNSNSFIQC